MAYNPPKAVKNSFTSNMYTNSKLYIPAGTEILYKGLSPWKDFQNIRIIGQDVPVNSISLNYDEYKLSLNKTLQLSAIIQPSNATYQQVVWKSSNTKIAAVSDDGLVTGINFGKATITATCDGISATCEITISEITADEIKLNIAELSLKIDENFQLEATISPDDATDQTITWASSDENVATVSNDGLVTGLGVGTATITASCGDVSATCEVTVSAIMAEEVSLDITEISMTLNGSVSLTATVSPDNTTDKTIKWTSSDEKVATVSNKGEVKAVGAGNAVITASCGEVSATCEVTVYDADINIEFANNMLIVNVEGLNEPVSVSLFSVFGQCILKQDNEAEVVVNQKIDLSKLTSGTYIVQVVSGKMSATERIVK